jgi:predicted short-subunit dehydrogenase-like oxidoreductase (DUF2520 family)
MTSFAVIGAGRLGTSLALALTRKGWILTAMADRSPAAARESRSIVGRGRITADPALAAANADIVFICIPDDAVPTIARALARRQRDWSGRVAVHTSGLLPAAVLDPLEKRGAVTASVHPVQSFPSKTCDAGRLRGITWGLEGSPKGVAAGRAVVRLLGGRPLVLTSSQKPIYHAACSLASNGFVALEAGAASLLRATGIGRKRAEDVLMPLVQGTLQNVKELGLQAAFTGPVSRGDSRTVTRHLQALAAFPMERDAYRTLALLALELLAGPMAAPARIRALKRSVRGK